MSRGVHGSGRVETSGVHGSGPGRFLTQLKPDRSVLGGKKSDPKPTAGVNRLSQFWVWVEISSIRSVSGRPRSCKIIAEKCKNSPDLHQNH